MRISLFVIPSLWIAAAEVRAEPEAAASHVVRLVVAGTPEDAEALAEVVTELLRRRELVVDVTRVDQLDVEVVATSNPSARPAVARAWVDFASPAGPDGVRQAMLYLTDGSWERIRVRRVELAGDGVDEVAREELAHMLEFGVEGILAGWPLDQTREEVRRELGLPAEEPPPEPVEPPAPTPDVPLEMPVVPAEEPNDFSLELGFGYEVTGFASDPSVSHGPAATLALGLKQVWLRPALTFTAQYRVPVEVDTSPIGAELDQGIFRLTASIDLPLIPDLGFTVLLGGGLDAVWTTPRLAAGAAARLSEPSTAVFGVMRAGVGLRARLFGSMVVLLTMACDVDGQQRSYTVRRDDETFVVLEPWRVRPLGMVVLAFDLLDPAGREIDLEE